MAYSPISLSGPPQYFVDGEPASGYVLKAYSAGTSTLLQMATDSTGGTLVNDIDINSEGYPEVSGNVVVPHVNANYKLALYPSQTAADANSGATWTIDNLTPTGISSDTVQTIATLTDLRNYDGVATTVILEGSASSGDGLGAIYYFTTGASAGTYTDDGETIIVPTGGDGSEAWLLITLFNGILSDDAITLGDDFGSDTARLIIEKTPNGNLVRLLRDGAITHTSASSVTSTAGLISSAYRPTNNVVNVYTLTIGGGSPIVAKITVDSNGTITIAYSDYAGAASAQSSTQSGFSITWFIPDP